MQSSNNNNSFLFHGVTEGSNSGIAPSPGSSAPNIHQQSPNPISRHHNDTPPSFPALPSTPNPANIDPRDGIINYLIYQGLLAPDLSLTISPADLNTILANRTAPDPSNSELFPVPTDTFHVQSDQHPIRTAHFPTFSDPPISHSNLPPPRLHPLFPPNSIRQPIITTDRNTRANSFSPGNSSSAVASTSPIPTFRPLHLTSNNQLPSQITAQLPTLPADAPFSGTTRSSSPPTTAGVDIFHSLHSPVHPNNSTNQSLIPGSNSNTTRILTSSNIRPSQSMTPDQIARMFRTTTTPPHQAHLDASHTSRITNTVSTRLKSLIPHRSPLIHSPDSGDGTRDFDLQCLAADFYLTVYNELTAPEMSLSTPGTNASAPRNNGLQEYQSFFDAQTKHKDKYYTPKLPAGTISEIAFVRFASNFYSLLEDCPLYRVEYLLLPKYADANAVPNITTVHTVIKWLWQKLYQACEVNPKATELLTSSTVYDPHAAWVALHRHFLPQDPITTMSRETRLSTLRQRPSETNGDFLNRFFEDLLVIEYTGFPLEERRVSHFIITALSDPNHRQNASIQYQHLKQSSTHSFDYWLSVLRSLPTTNPTLPLGLHHANLTSNQPRTYPETNASSNPKPPADNNFNHDSSYHSNTCSHCGRYGHLSTHCFHNPASTTYNHNSRTTKYDSPFMNRRSQSPNTPRHSSSYPKHNSPSRSPSSHSSRPNSPYKRSVQPRKSSTDTRYRNNSAGYYNPPDMDKPSVEHKTRNKPETIHANISTYEPDKNKISLNYPTNVLPRDHIGHGAPNYDSVAQDKSFSYGMPKIYNSINYAPFSDIRPFPSTETIGNLTVDRESLHTNNYINNFELPSSPNHATDIPSSPGDSDSSQYNDIVTDASPDVSPRKRAHSSSNSTLLHIGFTFLHPTPTIDMNHSHLADRLPKTTKTFQPFASTWSPLSTFNSCPILHNPIKLNTNNFSPSSKLPPVIYDHISRLSCLHALGQRPFYTIFAAILSHYHLSFLPPLDYILPTSHKFTDYEAALYLSLYESLPPHYYYVAASETRPPATILSIIRTYNRTQNVAQLPTPIPISRRFTDIEAALYLSITGLLPPHYKLTTHSHRAPTVTKPHHYTNSNLPYSAPVLIPEPLFCFMLNDSTTASTSDTHHPTISSPAPAPSTPPSNLPPLPTITTTSATSYPDPLTSHDNARTLAMRCLRETSSPNLNPDVIPEMERALTTAIDQLNQETTDMETFLPRLPTLIANLQNYQRYCTSRLDDTRHTITHLQAVRSVIMTLIPRTSVSQPTSTSSSTLTPQNTSTVTVQTNVSPALTPTQTNVVPTTNTTTTNPAATNSTTPSSMVSPPLINETSNTTTIPTQPQIHLPVPVPTSSAQHISPNPQHGNTSSTQAIAPIPVTSTRSNQPRAPNNPPLPSTNNPYPDRNPTDNYRAPERPRPDYIRRNRSNSPPSNRRTDYRSESQTHSYHPNTSYPDYGDYAPYSRDYSSSRRPRDQSPPTRNVRPYDTSRTYIYDSNRAPTRHSTSSLPPTRDPPNVTSVLSRQHPSPPSSQQTTSPTSNPTTTSEPRPLHSTYTMTQLISMPTNPQTNDSIPGELPANPATDLTYPAPRGYFYENLPPPNKSTRPTLDDPTAIRSSISTDALNNLHTPRHLGLAIFEQYTFTADDNSRPTIYLEGHFITSQQAHSDPLGFASIPEFIQYYWQRIELFHWMPENEDSLLHHLRAIGTRVNDPGRSSRLYNYNLPSRFNTGDYVLAQFRLWLLPAIARLRQRVFSASPHFSSRDSSDHDNSPLTHPNPSQSHTSNLPIMDLTGSETEAGWTEQDALLSYQLSSLPTTIITDSTLQTSTPSTPFSHLRQALTDTSSRSTLLLSAPLLCKHVEAHNEYLTNKETKDLLFILRTLHLAHRCESTSRNHLWQLHKHIEYIRDPTMSTSRRQAAEIMRQRLSTSDNTTLGQLERLDLFIESNADLQPHRDALYLSDLDLLFSDLQHKITSLRDNTQLPLRRLHSGIYTELHRRRTKPTAWHNEVQQYNTSTQMGDPLSHFARIIASDFYDALRPTATEPSPLILELLSSQWVQSPTGLNLSDLDPTQMTLTHLQEESVRHFHRVTKSVRVPTHYTSVTRQIILALPLLLLQSHLRQYIIPFSEYSSELFNSITTHLPLLQLQPFQPTTMDAGHRHPISQLPHQTASELRQQSSTAEHFSYRRTTTRLPQAPILTPILTHPHSLTEPPPHMKDSILGTFHFHQSLHHILQRAHNLTALTVPEIEIHLFSTHITTTAPPEASEIHPTTQTQSQAVPEPSPTSLLNFSPSTHSSTVNNPDPTSIPDVSITDTNIPRVDNTVISSTTTPGSSTQTATTNITSSNADTLPITDMNPSILLSNALSTFSCTPAQSCTTPNDEDDSCTLPITQTLTTSTITLRDDIHPSTTSRSTGTILPRRSTRLLSHPAFTRPSAIALTRKRSLHTYHNNVVHNITSNAMTSNDMSTDVIEFTVILDSGATAHMFNTIAHFLTYTPCTHTEQHRIRVANGTSVPVLGFGTLPGGHKAMFVPQLAHNILSVDALDEKGYSTLFANGIGKVFDRSSRKIILTVPRDPLTRLYTLNQSDFERTFKLTHQSCLAHSCSNLNPIMRIHYIYGHPSAARTRYLCKCLGVKTNLSIKNFECVRNCDICHLVKSKRQKTVQHITRMQILGKVWYHDIKGPFATPSLHFGNRYQSAYRESKSRLNFLTFIQHKSDVYASTKTWIQNYIIPLRATNPTIGPIFIVSDMGEFNKEQIRTELLFPNGIFSVTTCPYVPAHNGVIERYWRTLTDATICQLLASNLPESYWEESARCANYILNRITDSHPELNPHSPYEDYFGIPPPINHFRIFGSVCYVKNMLAPKQPRPKSFRGIFVGYEDRQQVGYRIYLPEYKNFTVSFHVDFSSADNIFKDVQNQTLTEDQIDSIIQTITHTSPTAQTSTQSPQLLTPTPNPNDKQKIHPQEEYKPRRSPRLHTSLTTEAIHSIALEDINNLQLHYPTLSPLIYSYFHDLIPLQDTKNNTSTKNTENDNTAYIPAKGTLTDNPKSLAAIERVMHNREGSLRSVSSTADHPKDEKICGIKRSNPPPDWPSSACSTRSFLSTMTTGTTTQEMQMSRHDADPTSHTSCLHGKRLCQQVDVNRRCIPSVTAAMTKERNETPLVTTTQLHLTPINKDKINLFNNKSKFRVRFTLSNNVITFPTDAVDCGHENMSIFDTDNIVGKLLIHPHTDLLCTVHRILTFGNKTLVRLYYCTRNTQPTTYIIPPLLSLATTLRLTQFHEDYYQSIYNDPVSFTIHVLKHLFGTGGVFFKFPCLLSLSEHKTHQ